MMSIKGTHFTGTCWRRRYRCPHRHSRQARRHTALRHTAFAYHSSTRTSARHCRSRRDARSTRNTPSRTDESEQSCALYERRTRRTTLWVLEKGSAASAGQ